MKDVFETLSNYVKRIERFEGQFLQSNIIVSTQIPKKEILIDGDDERITKEPILWRLYHHYMFYIVTVPPGTRVQRHKHDEHIFRYIAQGSLTVNKRQTITAGTWFVIKAGTPYQIESKEGYVSLTAYTSVCRTNRGAMGTHLVKPINVRSVSSKKQGVKK